MSSTTIALDARLAGRDATGDSSYWTGLLHGLAELDSSLDFLLFSNGPRPPGIPESARFRWISLPGGSSRWWSLVRFPRLARKHGAGAIHTQYNLSPLVGKRGITTIHDVSFLIGPEWFKKKDLFLLKRFVPSSARRAAKVITVSKTSKGEIERLIPAALGKVAVAPLSPKVGIHPVDAPKPADPFLLTVGTRWPRKNMRLAVEACELLPTLMPHKLVITGKPGWGEETLGSRVAVAGYVSDEDLSRLYSTADLYLAPSLHEGFGIPVLEAFVCGCPVVCSSGGALPEVAGEAALVMKSWEPRHWAEGIAELLSDSSKLDAMRRKGRERAAQFSWRKCAEIHERVYREVAG